MTKATELHRQVCSDVAVTSITRRPRAIVVVLGDEQQKQQQLDEYVELYHSLQCSTVSTTNVEGAAAIGREAARLVRVAQLSEMGMGHVPIVIHVMGKHGVTLVEELERQSRLALNDDDDSLVALQHLCHSCPPRTDTAKALNTSSRSLLTNETDPMSSDDEDDESISGDCSISPVSALKARRRPVLQQQSPSPQQCRPRHQTRTPPSVHRIDMERTEISFPGAPNPQEKALKRDLDLFCSHLSIMLWDIPPPAQLPSKCWTKKIQDLVMSIVLSLIFCWRLLTSCLFEGMGILSQEQRPGVTVPGTSFSRQHALLYCNDRDKTVQALLKLPNVVMESKLTGTRQQHGALYVDFVEKMLDRICLPACGNDDDDDGWSSDEDE